ncbi:hypothetical protein EYF80_017551 [Liparis tanakae]|uniref:Uncharacterized protein n=1 Tax=Liparis tanakae TaxID=230148 RepID=A0A4Z2I2Q8_9TELE|nr:hypothetical protein EYF80_017551 [Liparis tanakae]
MTLTQRDAANNQMSRSSEESPELKRPSSLLGERHIVAGSKQSKCSRLVSVPGSQTKCEVSCKEILVRDGGSPGGNRTVHGSVLSCSRHRSFTMGSET